MNFDLFLPGAVILLKAFFKLTIDRQLKMRAFVNGLIFFPIDLVFLGFSYSVAALVVRTAGMDGTALSKYPAFLAVMYILAGVFAGFLSSKSERFLDADMQVRSALIAASAYFIGFMALGYAVLGGVNV